MHLAKTASVLQRKSQITEVANEPLNGRVQNAKRHLCSRHNAVQ